MKKVFSVDEYILSNPKFEGALKALREIIISLDFEENIKWNMPVYSYKSKNVLGIAAFKNHIAIWFYNGVFLKDKHKLLISAQDKTKAMRQIRFKTFEDILDKSEIIQEYAKEALENQKEGKEFKPKKVESYKLSDELKKQLETDKQLKDRFYKFSIAKQKEFSDYISNAKRMDTKQKRIDKISPLIKEGRSLHDIYRRKK